MLLDIQDYMSRAIRGDVQVSPENLELFVKESREAIEKQFGGRKREYRIRMSGLGKPLCQQILDKFGIEETMQYNSISRFAFGDLTEALLMLVMREAGIDIVDFQKEVELEIADITLKGTLDVIIRGTDGVERVWDIKSASDWAFKNKFTGSGGYEHMKNDDPFGYIMQGHLYGAAMGMDFGGWIVINKSSGEVAIVEAYDWTGEDRTNYLADAEDRVRFLVNPDSEPFKPFADEFETYKRKGEVIRTGNKVLPKECSLCGFRGHCWPDAILHERVTSQAKSPPKVWYSRLKTKEL
jgi:hypothetical protein